MRLPFLIALLAALLPTPSLAEPPDADFGRARAHLAAGVADYDQGRYEDAAREMEAAYALKPLADLQYNLAQCYERLGRLKEAASSYRRYLDGKPGSDDHDTVAQRIAHLEERIRLEHTGAPPPPSVVEKVVLKEVVIFRDAPPPPGRGARFAAYGLAVLAVGSLASGIALAVLTQHNASLVRDGADPTAPPTFQGSFADAQANGRVEMALSWVGFGVAVASAVGAVGLFVLGRNIDREAPKLTLLPSFSPTGAGLAFGGSF